VSSSSPDRSITRVELTGPPTGVDQLVSAMSGTGEVIHDSRSEPNARGEVTGIAEVVTASGTDVPVPPAAARVTLQAVFTVDLSLWADLSAEETRSRLEESTAELLRAVPGSSDAQARVVSVLRAHAPQP